MMNRRDFLLTAMLSAAGSCFAGQDRYADFYKGERTIFLSRDGRTIKRTFFTNSGLDRNAYEDVCYFLCDKHEGVAVEMDIELLSGVSFIQKFLLQNGINRPLIANSGYRTPKTNANTEGAVRNSYHTRGSAIDGFIPSIDNYTLAAIAERVGFGGIGLYKTFVHLDTGGFRRWSA